MIQLGLGILSSLMAALILFVVGWFWREGFPHLDTPTILLLLATLALAVHLFLDVRGWLKRRASDKLHKPDRNLTDLVRKIKVDIEKDYSELVAGSLLALFQPGFNRGGSRGDYGGFSQMINSYMAAGYGAFRAKWEKHLTFREFQARTKNLPIAISRQEFGEIVALYRESINDYLNLRAQFELMIRGKEAIAKQNDREGAIQTTKAAWNELQRKLDSFEAELRKLHKYLRAYDVDLTFEGGSDLVARVA